MTTTTTSLQHHWFGDRLLSFDRFSLLLLSLRISRNLFCLVLIYLLSSDQSSFSSTDFILCQCSSYFKWKTYHGFYFRVHHNYSKETYRFNIHLISSKKRHHEFFESILIILKRLIGSKSILPREKELGQFQKVLCYWLETISPLFSQDTFNRPPYPSCGC